MIHHFTEEPKRPPDKANWWLRLGIMLLISTLVGLLYLWLAGNTFLIPFLVSSAAQFSLLRCADLELEYAPCPKVGSWLVDRHYTLGNPDSALWAHRAGRHGRFGMVALVELIFYPFSRRFCLKFCEKTGMLTYK